MRTKTYTPEQAEQMIAAYNTGLTLREVGERFYCSWQTAANYIRLHGGKVRGKSHIKRNVYMIMNDWNAGLNIDRIANVYRFPSRNAVYQFVHVYREYGFLYRNKQNMTNSESTMAGSIRQSEATQ